VDNFASEGTEIFYLEAAARPELGVYVSALLLEGRSVATHWGVRGGGTMYYLMPTFDTALERYSPGKVFLLRFLRRCVDEGLARLDFTIGDEAYKDKFCDDAMALYATVAGLSLRGKLFAARERALAALKHGPLLGLARSTRHKARSALRNYRNGGPRA
jgi:CelD/BcsL family acetyltransferase involved in cellulose biosynthesis